jgi:hypothetical protein
MNLWGSNKQGGDMSWFGRSITRGAQQRSGDEVTQVRSSAQFNAGEVNREAEDLTRGHRLSDSYSRNARRYLAEANYPRFWDQIEVWEKFIDRLERDGDVLREDYHNYGKAAARLRELVGPSGEVPPVVVTSDDVKTLTLLDVYRVERFDLMNEGLRVPACAAIYEQRRGAAAVQSAIHTATASIRADQAADASRRLKALEDLQWRVEQIQHKLPDGL